MIAKETEAKILRLYHAEKWRVCSIARELGIHHSTVARVLERNGAARESSKRPSRLEPFVSFISETLARYPNITASRLYGMAQERGYEGGPDHFRHEIRRLRLRLRKPSEAFLRLRTLPAEEAQVDWAHFGRLKIGRAKRPLMAFVMVLSYSRRIFLHFFPGQSTTHFLRGHVMALTEFGGSPRRILYDNLKSAVLDRRGDAIRFNPDLLALCAHYRIEPRPVAPYRGNEKGRVERAIRYVRTAFFEALEWHTLDELNEKAAAFCATVAMHRKWRDDPSCSVADAFAEESSKLLALPNVPFPAFERVEVVVDKTAYVRFDLNDYSVPHDRIGRTLTVTATMRSVRILDGSEVVARHLRSFDKGAVVEDEQHRATIRKLKRRGRKGQSLDRLSRTAPESLELLTEMATRGQNIGSATKTLISILDLYGRDELRFGIAEAIAKGVFHPHAVRQAIERRRGSKGLGPALPLALPDDPRISDLCVNPHDLSHYDQENGNGD